MKSVFTRLFITITALLFAHASAYATTLGAISGGANVLNTYADAITINGNVTGPITTVKLTSTGGGITVKGKIDTSSSVYLDAKKGPVSVNDTIDNSSSLVVFTTGNTSSGCTAGSGSNDDSHYNGEGGDDDSDKDKDKDKDKDSDNDDSSTACTVTLKKNVDHSSNVVIKSSGAITIKGSVKNSSVVTWCGTSFTVKGSVDASSTTTKLCP